MVNIDPVVAEVFGRSTAVNQSQSDVIDSLSIFANESDLSYEHGHLDALRAAACFGLTTGDIFRGDFRGTDETPWPRTLAEISPEVLVLWDGYSAYAGTAFRAHLEDLLTTARFASPHIHARGAIYAYREVVPEFLASDNRIRGRLRAVESLVRALAIAVEMNQRDLRELVVRDILTLASDLLDEDEPQFGLVRRLLEALEVRNLETEAVRELAERALIADHETNLMFLGLLRNSYSDSDMRKKVDRRIVNAMLARADRAPIGAQRLLELDDAATTARDAGLTDLFQDARRRMQAMSQSNMGLVGQKITVSVSERELEEAFASVDGAAGLAEALWGIVGTNPPAGDISIARQAAKKLTADAPLWSSIAQGTINMAGPVPVTAASSDALTISQANFQVLHLDGKGIIIAEQLDRINSLFNPGEDELVSVFSDGMIGSESKTRMLVHAFQHFWAEEYDAAVHLALPRVEDLLRNIERARGVLVVNVAQGQTRGGLVQLGALIASMSEAGFDESWKESFSLLFTDGVNGLNLRNDVGHGLSDCPPKHHVALVLHAVLFLLRTVKSPLSE